MKLVMVLMLAALPLYCYAGSGCAYLEDVINETIDSSVSVEQYKNSLEEYIPDDATSKAVGEFKQCFLDQSNETLENFGTFMQVIYNSPWCALF
ncbi:mammaglobin-B isoform X1 [Tupaia chinensis]|uniref:mammaglobin-B isoform X1 n=1 Tax=Tupaia chinensis TaxID=246437 RepID=UPI0003C9148D|nr:mammaglobin-B isoform X1 [Tupaia chinensis]